MYFPISTSVHFHKFLTFVLQLDVKSLMYVLDILIHNLEGSSLEVQTNRTLVKVGEEGLTVAHKEVELVWRWLLRTRAQDPHLVSPALE